MSESMTAEQFRQRFKGRRGRGKLGGHKAGEMNKLEAAYSRDLDARKATGEVLWWAFESISFKLGPDCRYIADFVWMNADGEIIVDDCKGGFIAPEGRIKMAVAAEKFPLRFRRIQRRAKKDGGGWDIKEIG